MAVHVVLHSLLKYDDCYYLLGILLLLILLLLLLPLPPPLLPGAAPPVWLLLLVCYCHKWLWSNGRSTFCTTYGLHSPQYLIRPCQSRE